MPPRSAVEIKTRRPFKLIARIIASRRWRAKQKFLRGAAPVARREFQLAGTRIMDLPGLTQSAKDKIRERCGIAATRIVFNWRTGSAIGLSIFYGYLCFLAFLATTAESSLRADSGPASRIHLYSGVFLVGSVFLVVPAAMLARRVDIKMTSLERRFHLKRRGLLSVVLILASLWVLTDLSESRYSASSHHFASLLTLKVWILDDIRGDAFLLSATFFFWFIPVVLIYDWFWDIRHKSRRPEPLDRVMVSLLALAQDVNSCRFNRLWIDHKRNKDLLAEFDRIARQAERFATQRAPMFNFSLRRRARKVGLGLAELIRSYRIALVQAIGPASYEEVATSLATILEAWAYRDIARLTKLMPEVSLRDILRSVYRRLWQTLALAALGIGLPLVPVFRHSVTASTNIRVYLLIAAFLALVAPGSSLSDITNSALGRVVKL
jgi:hypothetical protein